MEHKELIVAETGSLKKILVQALKEFEIQTQPANRTDRLIKIKELETILNMSRNMVNDFISENGIEEENINGRKIWKSDLEKILKRRIE